MTDYERLKKGNCSNRANELSGTLFHVCRTYQCGELPHKPQNTEKQTHLQSSGNASWRDCSKRSTITY